MRKGIDMAEIVIKGVALPPKGECLMISVLSNGSVAYKLGSETAEHRTTAQELPDHGRLGDLDKAELAYRECINTCIERDPTREEQYRDLEKAVIGTLKRTPTVIPASVKATKDSEITITAVHVDRLPEKEEMDPGKIYVADNLRVTAHLCCCGCGERVVLSIGPLGYKYSEEHEKPSLRPAIGNIGFPCESFYYIRDGKVVWC